MNTQVFAGDGEAAATKPPARGFWNGLILIGEFGVSERASRGAELWRVRAAGGGRRGLGRFSE
ncbi:MAG: hypothetical protein LBE17_10000 [Treponema sp.]|nr:hypothetical protein [Treponema sp.]